MNRPSSRRTPTDSFTMRRLLTRLPARFYAARGFPKVRRRILARSQVLLSGWGRWQSKAADQLYSPPQGGGAVRGATARFVTPTEFLDLATVIRVSQAVSGEMVLEKLIEKLVRIAVEKCRSQRGLAHPASGRRSANRSRGLPLARAGSKLPLERRPSGRRSPPIRAALRDPDAGRPCSWIMPRPITCMQGRVCGSRSTLSPSLWPAIVNQSKLVGVLFLENNLTPCASHRTALPCWKTAGFASRNSLENAAYIPICKRQRSFLAQGERNLPNGAFRVEVFERRDLLVGGTYNIFEYDRPAKPNVRKWRFSEFIRRQRFRSADSRARDQMKRRISMCNSFVGCRKRRSQTRPRHWPRVADLVRRPRIWVGAGTERHPRAKLAEEKDRQSESRASTASGCRSAARFMCLGPAPGHHAALCDQAALD